MKGLQDVPQGSVLVGEIFYLLRVLALYIPHSPLGDIVSENGMRFHFCADDSQLYFSFDSHSVEEKSFAVAQVEACVCEIDFWMRVNKLIS